MLLGETMTEFKEFSNSFDAAVSYIIFSLLCSLLDLLTNAMEKALIEGVYAYDNCIVHVCFSR